MALTACSEPPPLSAADKARFTAELIAERTECAVFLNKLATPNIDRSIIAQTYHAAKAAHCLKPDV